MRALFLIAIALLACRPRQPAPPSPPPEPQVVLHGAKMQMFRGSELVMVGRAARVTYQRLSADVSATEAVLRWPSRTSGGRRPRTAVSGIEVRAPEVDGNLYTRQADGRGGVLLRTSSGIAARTEDAHFDGVVMKMRGASPVKVTGPGYALDAAGFELSVDDEKLEFTGIDSSISGGAK